MYTALDVSSRRKFLLSVSPSIIGWLPVFFLLLALCALFFALVALNAIGWPDYIFSIPFLIWLASLGAIGSITFIAMNALSIQDDITFEITNTRLILIRISVGVLFAVLLFLPFGDLGFLNFCKEIWKPSIFHVSDSNVIMRQAASLLLPFVLGFSTSLVILIMSRMIDAVEVLFGISKERVA